MLPFYLFFFFFLVNENMNFFLFNTINPWLTVCVLLFPCSVYRRRQIFFVVIIVTMLRFGFQISVHCTTAQQQYIFMVSLCNVHVCVNFSLFCFVYFFDFVSVVDMTINIESKCAFFTLSIVEGLKSETKKINDIKMRMANIM